MKKKFIAVLLTSMLAVSTLSGCGGGTSKEADKKEDSSKKEIKIGMVTDTGGVNDQSFNQSAWEGLQKANKDLGIKVSYKESKQDADYPTNLETLLDSENDLIWGIGYKMGDIIAKAAKENPEQKYAIVDFSYEDKDGKNITPKNVIGVMFKQEEPSFLVGYIAAKTSKTNKIGFVGGIEGNIIHAFDYGYQAGAKYANKDVSVLRQYAESFTDSAKGKSIANSMYQQGADVVFHAAGGVGEGIIEAAKEKGKWAIGVDRDQNYLAPENVLTSAVKRVDMGVFHIAEDLTKGDFKGGQTITYGLKDGAVDIAPTSDKNVSKEILDEVAKIKQDIIDGKIVVPYDEKTYNEFVKNLK